MSRLASYPGMMNQRTPYQQSEFRKSLDRQRMRESRKAATFAGSQPMPSDPTAAAGRKAFIEDQTVAAEDAASNLGKGDNYFMGRELAQSADTRFNNESAAGIGYMGSMGRLNDARTGQINTLTPFIGRGMDARSGLDRSESGLLDARAGQVNTLTPFMGRQMEAQSQAMLQPQPAFDPKMAADLFGRGVTAGGQAFRSALPGMAQQGKLQQENERFNTQREDFAIDKQIEELSKSMAQAEPSDRPALQMQIQQLQQEKMRAQYGKANQGKMTPDAIPFMFGY